MRLTPILVLGILGLLGWFFLRFPLEARRAEVRNLDHFRVLALPRGLPPAWRQELTLALAAAPQVSLLSPTALLAARNVFAGLAWLDPASLQVESTLPLGLAVRFRMRRPVLQVQHRHEGQLSWALVTADGTVLPSGHPLASSTSLPRLISPVPLPVAGRVASDPLLNRPWLSFLNLPIWRTSQAWTWWPWSACLAIPRKPWACRPPWPSCLRTELGFSGAARMWHKIQGILGWPQRSVACKLFCWSVRVCRDCKPSACTVRCLEVFRFLASFCRHLNLDCRHFLAGTHSGTRNFAGNFIGSLFPNARSSFVSFSAR